MRPGQVAQHEPARLDHVLHNAAKRFGIEIAGKDGLGHACGSHIAREGNLKLPTDASDYYLVDFAMPWDGRLRVISSVDPNVVPRTVAKKLTPAVSQVALQIDAAHALTLLLERPSARRSS